MVGGRLRCMGPPQHLKNRFGKGYLTEIKIKAVTLVRMCVYSARVCVEMFCLCVSVCLWYLSLSTCGMWGVHVCECIVLVFVN